MDPVFRELQKVVSTDNIWRIIATETDPDVLQTAIRDAIDKRSGEICRLDDSLNVLYPEKYGAVYLAKVLEKSDVQTRFPEYWIGEVVINGSNKAYKVLYYLGGVLEDINDNMAYYCEAMGSGILSSNFFGSSMYNIDNLMAALDEFGGGNPSISIPLHHPKMSYLLYNLANYVTSAASNCIYSGGYETGKIHVSEVCQLTEALLDVYSFALAYPDGYFHSIYFGCMCHAYDNTPGGGSGDGDSSGGGGSEGGGDGEGKQPDL